MVTGDQGYDQIDADFTGLASAMTYLEPGENIRGYVSTQSTQRGLAIVDAGAPVRPAPADHQAAAGRTRPRGPGEQHLAPARPGRLPVLRGRGDGPLTVVPHAARIGCAVWQTWAVHSTAIIIH